MPQGASRARPRKAARGRLRPECTKDGAGFVEQRVKLLSGQLVICLVGHLILLFAQAWARED